MSAALGFLLMCHIATSTSVDLVEVQGDVRQRGSQKPLAYAVITADDGHALMHTQSDETGHFTLLLNPGIVQLNVSQDGFAPISSQEHISAESARQPLIFSLQRTDDNPYDTLILGQRHPYALSTATLHAHELTHVAGTFGDPFRVVTTLPGVGQVMSLLGYPIVRGTAPGNTGYLLDGVRVPQLFHFLAGPAVLHPEFIERIDFYPGGFPVNYGGYIGGIIDGITHRPSFSADESRYDFDFDLTQTGGFVRVPVPEHHLTATAAGRYGYPGAILSALDQGIGAEYWDYQLRLDGGITHPWKIFVFGSYDNLSERNNGIQQTVARTQFHRADMSYTRNTGAFSGTYRVTASSDQMITGNDSTNLHTLSLEPRARWTWRITDTVAALRFGIDTAFRQFSGFSSMDSIGTERRQASVGAFVDCPLQITQDLLVIPGVRADTYHTASSNNAAVDPRLNIRYRAAQRSQGDVWLKGSTGMFHQPPRFFVPVAGLEELLVNKGLVSSWQSSLGVEYPLTSQISTDVQVYYNKMNNLLYDLMVNDGTLQDIFNSQNTTDGLSHLLEPTAGTSYGAEFIVRKADRGRWFGWLSYTLSKSERRNAQGHAPFDFDRRHMLNWVSGVRLQQDWELGLRAQVQSGRPLNGYRDNVAIRRTTPLLRIDVRLSKRFTFDSWVLDAYLDVVNVTHSSEQLASDPGKNLNYVIPFAGVRAVF